MSDMFTLPDGLVTEDPETAAIEWAAAFYQVKDALERLRPVADQLLYNRTVRNLDEIYAECDKALLLGDK